MASCFWPKRGKKNHTDGSSSRTAAEAVRYILRYNLSQDIQTLYKTVGEGWTSRERGADSAVLSVGDGPKKASHGKEGHGVERGRYETSRRAGMVWGRRVYFITV